MGWLIDQARAIRDQDATLADPLGWFEQQQWPIWSLQRDITREIAKDGSRVLVPSCNGAGKTHIAALIAAWFALRYRENARVVIIGPSWDQLRDGTHAIIGGLELGAGVSPLRERHLTVDGTASDCLALPAEGLVGLAATEAAAGPARITHARHPRRGQRNSPGALAGGDRGDCLGRNQPRPQHLQPDVAPARQRTMRRSPAHGR